jgi:hypothetical protein
MRKPDKAALAKTLLIGLPPDELPATLTYVVDGGSLLHRVKWTKNTSFDQIIKQYVRHVQNKYGNGAIVIFDGYNEYPTTKGHEHCRRASKVKAKSPTVRLDPTLPAIFEQHAFLVNESNKDSLIKLLMTYLDAAGFDTRQSKADADIDIVSAALSVASKRGNVVAVAADDTDIFVLLVYHLQPDMSDMYFVSEAKKKPSGDLKPISIRKVQQHVGDLVRKQILVVHALSGCDTTSAMYGNSKGSVMKKINEQRSSEQLTKILLDETATVDEVATAGIQLMITV